MNILQLYPVQVDGRDWCDGDQKCAPWEGREVETLCQLYYWERFHGQPSAKHGLWSGVSGQSQQQTLPTLGVAGRLVQQ